MRPVIPQNGSISADTLFTQNLISSSLALLNPVVDLCRKNEFDVHDLITPSIQNMKEHLTMSE